MKRLTIFGLVLLVISLDSRAQESPSVDSLLEQLQSELPDERAKASRQIYGAGIDSAELYAAVADAIERGRETLHKDSPKDQQQEIAWHTKALGGSGISEYMQLLEELSQSPARTVAKHAKASRKTLAQTSKDGSPYLDYRRVEVITDIQAEKCQFVMQEDCSTYRSLEKCLDYHRNYASRNGANAIMVLHDSDQAGWFKAGMMASYYKCRQGVTVEAGTILASSDQEKPQERSYTDELRELAQLRDDGIISEEEFQIQKAKILAEN